VWSTRDLAITVVIKPAWWQVLWVRIPGIVLVVSLIVFLYRRRVSRLRADKLAQQEFSRKLIESQEAERKRLAAELHDGLGQDLLVASNELQQFLGGQHESRDDLERAEGLVQGSIQTLREISSNLHPHHLDRLGFCAAVEAMTSTVGHSSGLTIECTCDDVDGLMPKEVEIHIYRVIQEALSNVVHHAEATKVTVLVRRHPNLIEVMVTDNGHGFVHEAGLTKPSLHAPVKRRLGFGLSSMEERARIISGTLTIASSPGSGTTVGLTCPYS
jgi:signal transduction histidine kinase